MKANGEDSASLQRGEIFQSEFGAFAAQERMSYRFEISISIYQGW